MRPDAPCIRSPRLRTTNRRCRRRYLSTSGVMIPPVILRCTAKLLSLLGIGTRELAVFEPSNDDWYANLLWLGRRKWLLLGPRDTALAVRGPPSWCWIPRLSNSPGRPAVPCSVT